jgi:hypothetical protein
MAGIGWIELLILVGGVLALGALLVVLAMVFRGRNH